MEAPMNRTIPLVALLIVLSLVTPSWSGPPNPTDSDANFNTAGGHNALPFVTTGEDNTAFGYLALYQNITADNNTAVGFEALVSNVSGSFNTAFGWAALLDNINGVDNTAFGANALRHNTAGSLNTAAGTNALENNTTGSRNTATGLVTLIQNTTASDNTGIGAGALRANTTGHDNSASGTNALFSNTAGSFNTADGHNALDSNSTGTKNTAFGYQSLLKSTGNRNAAIGYTAGATLSSGNNNIYLGHDGAANESLTMRLGNNQTSTFIAGIAATTINDRPVMIDANGQLGVVLSSGRYKGDVEPLGGRGAGVHELRPVTFAYRDDAPGTMHYGLIAEEVQTVYPELVTQVATGEVHTVRYQALIPLLLDELQRQEMDLQHQQQMIEQQGHELGKLRALVEHRRRRPGVPGAFRDLGVVNMNGQTTSR